MLERVREGVVGAAVTSGPVAGGVEKHQRWAEAEAAEEAEAPRDAELRKESYRREYEEVE